jgi:hypothetical protein
MKRSAAPTEASSMVSFAESTTSQKKEDIELMARNLQ